MVCQKGNQTRGSQVVLSKINNGYDWTATMGNQTNPTLSSFLKDKHSRHEKKKITEAVTETRLTRLT
jgi:hypothetical protein